MLCPWKGHGWERWYEGKVYGHDHVAHSGSNEVWGTCTGGDPGHFIHRWDNSNGNSLDEGGLWIGTCSTKLELLDQSHWVLWEWEWQGVWLVRDGYNHSCLWMMRLEQGLAQIPQDWWEMEGTTLEWLLVQSEHCWWWGKRPAWW